MPSDGLPKNLEPLAAGDPATIGPYVLAGRLGSGGMGTVYLGRTPEKGAQVAIKVIRPELAFDEATRARFHDEMENARRVASFCTAKVLDHGTFENRPYMVTEYIAGTALAEHIAQNGPLDASTLHGFALGVAAALAAIHRADLVHRDLKPANVLLSLSGPRVIDFGIARAMNTATNHTKTGIVMGSPGWMAPEQLLEEQVTTAADIFAWGCLVAFAGSGTHPFGNGDAMTLGKRVLFAEPQISDLDAPLDRLVARALAKEPERRPKAQDLLLELAGGENPDGGAGYDPNAMVSEKLHQSWRPNLPPMPPAGPMPPGPMGPGPNPNMTNGGMPVQPPGPPRGGPVQPPFPGPPQGGPPRPGPHTSQPVPLGGARPGPPGPPGQVPASQTGQFARVGPPAPPNPQSTGPIPQIPVEQQAQPYVPPAPPPPHRPMQPNHRRIRWVTLTAVVALVLVAALLAVLTFVAGNGLFGLFSGRDAEQEAPQNAAPQSNSEDEDAAPAPHVASDGQAEFTVEEYRCDAQVGDRSEVVSGDAVYCVFTVMVRNTGSDPIQLEPGNQVLSVPGEPSERAQPPMASERDDSLWSSIAQGQRARGELVFIVTGGDGRGVDRGTLELRSVAQTAPASVEVSDIPDPD